MRYLILSLLTLALASATPVFIDYSSTGFVIPGATITGSTGTMIFPDEHSAIDVSGIWSFTYTGGGSGSSINSVTLTLNGKDYPATVYVDLTIPGTLVAIFNVDSILYDIPGMDVSTKDLLLNRNSPGATTGTAQVVFSAKLSPIPEPGTYALTGLMSFGILLLRARRGRKSARQ